MSGFWDDVADTIGTVAPTLGVALGGPLGGLAGTLISKALGVDPSDPEKAKAILQTGTPEQLLALKKAEQEFTVALRTLDLKAEDIAAQDRNSARQRETAVRDRIPGALAIILTLGFFGLLVSVLAHEPPPGSRDFLNVMLGSLGSGWVAMLSYYFGSSASNTVHAWPPHKGTTQTRG